MKWILGLLWPGTVQVQTLDIAYGDRARTVWHSRIIGVHVDAERIYVAPWSVSERGRGLGFLLPPEDRVKTPLRARSLPDA